MQRVLAPTVREMHKNVAACAGAQIDLTAHIDRLAHELEILPERMPEPAGGDARQADTRHPRANRRAVCERDAGGGAHDGVTRAGEGNAAARTSRGS